MLKKIVAITLIGVLSGCSLVDGEKYSQTTINAVNRSETNLHTRLDAFDGDIIRQNEQIKQLRAEVGHLNDMIVALGHSQARRLAQEQPQEICKVSHRPAEISPAVPSQTLVLGAVEKVRIDAIKTLVDARVDTGAETSSLNAIDVQEFERNGKTWIRFHINDSAASAKEKPWIEAPVIRYVKIRQSNHDEAKRRPVIKLWIRLGKIHQQAEVTLADRSKMSHPMLLGREFIQDIALVDVSKTYLQSAKELSK